MFVKRNALFTAEARRLLCQTLCLVFDRLFLLDLSAEFDLLQVHFKDLDTLQHCWKIDADVSVETTRA